jgi:excisionase family DNA binding protein
METFPEHVVCAWIGNSKAVARKHYLTVHEVDYDRAAHPSAEGEIGGPPKTAQVVQKQADVLQAKIHANTRQPVISIGASNMDQMMTPEEVATLLNISKSTLCRITKTGRIPHVRISERCVRYDRAAIDAWRQSWQAPAAINEATPPSNSSVLTSDEDDSRSGDDIRQNMSDSGPR